MGCSVYARAIIGVRLPRPPFKEVKERGCQHSLAKSVFCGECGAKMWITESRSLLESRLGTFNLFEGGSPDNTDYYVGICATQTDDCMYVPPGVYGGHLLGMDMGLLRCQLEALLKPIGLWGGDVQVGLWVFGFTYI